MADEISLPIEHTQRNILVTGGAGFIGSNHIEYLLKNYADINVVNLDKLTYAGDLNNLSSEIGDDRHHFIRGDICDRDLLGRIFSHYDIDTVIHFAAESHVDRSISNPLSFVETNVVGTCALLESARKYWSDGGGYGRGRSVKFHHISTDEVYGSLGINDAPFSEETPYAPNSPYSASKAASDHLVRAYFHTYGLPVTTSNCSNNYGPRQHAEKLIPTVIRSCLSGSRIPVYGDGSNIRDWLYVMDHCSGVDAVIAHGRCGETYNIGGHNEKSNMDIVHSICKIMDEKFPKNAPHAKLIEYVTDRPGHDWRYAINPEKIAIEIGWRHSESFDGGIRKTIDWYLRNAR